MSDRFSRNELYWGKEGQRVLSSKSVAVFGLGGVGGYCVEMLARAGVGKLILVDFDTVSTSNINRQIIALDSTVGKSKVQLFEERIKNINPEVELTLVEDFSTDKFDILSGVDFVADAIDTMRSKISLLEYCYKNNIRVISSMGAGNRCNPEKLYVTDISNIRGKKDVFCSNVLYQLKKRGIESGIAVVTSEEAPQVRGRIKEKETIALKSGEVVEFNKIIPSSTPFVASVSGIFAASYIVREFLKITV